jgi:hypothetical protein
MKAPILLLLIVLVACAPVDSTSPPAAVPAQTTATAAVTPVLAPSTQATDVAAPGVVYGRTDDGVFFHGAADAPVTLIDYADFL